MGSRFLKPYGGYKYIRGPSDENLVEKFLEEEGMEGGKRQNIVDIVQGMGEPLPFNALQYNFALPSWFADV